MPVFDQRAVAVEEDRLRWRAMDGHHDTVSNRPNGCLTKWCTQVHSLIRGCRQA
jgi:hypothetical protein